MKTEGNANNRGYELQDQKLVQILADQLFKCRFRHGGTQQEVAREIGISRTTLADLESGLGNPSMGVVVKVARFYKVKLDDLFWDPQNRKRVEYRRGEVTSLRVSEFISVRQILSHQQQIRVREFAIAEGKRVQLKAGNRDWKELLICNQGQLDVSGFAQGVLIQPGQFLELIPEVEKKIWSIKGESIATLIQVKDRLRIRES